MAFYTVFVPTSFLQDLKGSIRVFCRIRPAGATGDGSGSCTEVIAEGELATFDPMKVSMGDGHNASKASVRAA